MLRTHRFTTAAVALALCAAAPAGAQDHRSPDAIDAAECGSITQCDQARQDLRTPDAIDAGTAKATQTQDLRTPDAIDAGTPRQSTAASAPERVRIVEVPSNGFEWGDAGIGAAGMLALVLVGVGLGMAATSRRRGRRFPATR
jgi:hypothetical protein